MGIPGKLSRMRRRAFLIAATLGLAILETPAAASSQVLKNWLDPQEWKRDTDSPSVSLGLPGDFDDRHILGPAVMRLNGSYILWYCGSQSSLISRAFKLGMASSGDGRIFVKYGNNPIWSLPDTRYSILTPTILRSEDSSPLLENGRMRMWFSSTRFDDTTGLHTLHETSSSDGIKWDDPSTSLARDVYAPSIIKVDEVYKMWYVDPSSEPWRIRYAESADGSQWTQAEQAVLEVDQEWESGRLVYPFVIKTDSVYLMWYASYWTARTQTTAIGFAVSLDGRRWQKHPGNPILTPDTTRFWESNYVSSHSVMRMADSSFRIWYASRKKPPFDNKYFAISTATWKPEPAKIDLAGGGGLLNRRPRLIVSSRDGAVVFDSDDSIEAIDVFDLQGKRIVTLPVLSGRARWEETRGGRASADKGIYLARTRGRGMAGQVRFKNF